MAPQALFSRVFSASKDKSARGVGVGVVTLFFKPYMYVRPRRVWFLGLFGLTTGIDFAHFGLKSGMVFERTRGAYERIYRFNSK